MQSPSAKASPFGEANDLLTADNEAVFFGLDKPLKAVLFTKKTETPKLWMRLAEQWGGSCVFGEIRLSEQGLMDKHGIKEEDLPRVVAFFATEGGGELGHRPLSYEGPTDFDQISDFLGDLAKGGTSFLEVRRVADEKQKEIERLQAQLERERETVGVAKAEIARNLLGQVGHDAAIQKDLQQEKARAKELDTAAAQLRAEKEALELEIRALKEVQGSFLIKLHGDNVDAFLSNTTRPLKAVLFTTKPDTPPLWSALAEAQSTTTAFAIVHHIETALMQKFKLQDLDLPRICIYSSGKEPVVYDGEVKLDALSSFLRDTVQGGDAVIALRQQVHNGVREIERLTTELAESRSDVEMLKSAEGREGKETRCDKCLQTQTKLHEGAQAAEMLAAMLRARN